MPHAFENSLRLIVDASFDAIVVMNEQGEVAEWNRQAEGVFGWSRSEALGKLVSDLIVPEEHQHAHRLGLTRFLATGRGPVLNQRIEVRARHRNGKIFPAELSIRSIETVQGWRFVAFIRDLADRDRSAAAESQLAAIAASSADSIIGVNREGLVTAWNAAAEKLYGWSAEEMLGQPIAQLTPPDRMEETLSLIHI